MKSPVHRNPSAAKKPRGRRPLTAYNIFFREQRVKMLQEKAAGTLKFDCDLFSGMGKLVAKRWKELTPEERAHYRKLADEDTKRFALEKQHHAGRFSEQKPSTQVPFPATSVIVAPEVSPLAALLMRNASKNVPGTTSIPVNLGYGPKRSRQSSLPPVVQAVPSVVFPPQAQDTLMVQGLQAILDRNAQITEQASRRMAIQHLLNLQAIQDLYR